MRREAARAAALALLAPLFLVASGCVGGVACYTQRLTLAQPQVKWWPDPDGALLTVSSATTAGAPEEAGTRAQLEQYWGRPDAVDVASDGLLRWTYNDELRWNGVLVMVVILPIPLIVPVGHDSITLVLRGEEIVGAEIVAEEKASALFGLVIENPGPCMGFGFGRWESSSHGDSLERSFRRSRAEVVAPPVP